MDPGPTTISYADPTAQAGVVIERDEDRLRIAIPSTRRIRDLPIGYKIGVPYLLLCAGAPLLATILQRRTEPAALFNGTLYLVILASVLWYTVRRFRRRAVIEIGPSDFVIREMIGEKILRSRNWPRQLIGVVRRNPSDDKLVIHVTGRTMIELLVGGANRQITEHVADAINDALQTIPAAPREAVAAQPGHDEIQAMRKGPARSSLLIIGGAIGCVAIVMIFLGLPWAALSFYLFIVAAIPVGVAMGMQDKSYYFF